MSRRIGTKFDVFAFLMVFGLASALQVAAADYYVSLSATGGGSLSCASGCMPPHVRNHGHAPMPARLVA